MESAYRPKPFQPALRWSLPEWLRQAGRAAGRYVVGLVLVLAGIVAAFPVPTYLGAFLFHLAGINYVQDTAAVPPPFVVHWFVGILVMSTFWWAPKLGQWLVDQRGPKKPEPFSGL